MGIDHGRSSWGCYVMPGIPEVEEAVATWRAVHVGIGARQLYSKKTATSAFQLIPAAERLRETWKPDEQPFLLLLGWLMSKEKHMSKYAKIYLEQGFDVLSVRITPMQMLWPVKGTQVVAERILDQLHALPPGRPICIHGFSVGGYLFGECLVRLYRSMEKYQGLMQRFVGQVWDSVVDFENIPQGFPKAISTNPVLRKSIEGYIKYHLRVFYNVATVHYKASSEAFVNRPLPCPALFLTSEADPVGEIKKIIGIVENMNQEGIKALVKVWKKSTHCNHFKTYPEDYLSLLGDHLDQIGLLPFPEKFAAHLVQGKKQRIQL
ncbi:unnamed protein product [Darwinula stevensoni]|uniref:Uncharacterized protein n=1 Tax=Darwinula stevensoni TaxID=69355 RepID=A0A7R9A693_9CRUS|nr:unnamed protein product [Darwinula stevensoni]CAG0887082.1 unnamed protein product [Darwinula stevensoni]